MIHFSFKLALFAMLFPAYAFARNDGTLLTVKDAQGLVSAAATDETFYRSLFPPQFIEGECERSLTRMSVNDKMVHLAIHSQVYEVLENGPSILRGTLA